MNIRNSGVIAEGRLLGKSRHCIVDRNNKKVKKCQLFQYNDSCEDNLLLSFLYCFFILLTEVLLICQLTEVI